MKIWTFLVVLISLSLNSCMEESDSNQQEFENTSKLKALIIDGQNNHGVWPKTTIMMKDYLEETGLFDVDINRTSKLYQGPHHDKIKGVEDIQELLEMYPLDDGKKYVSTKDPEYDPEFSPNFSKYDVVISNLGWKTAPWPAKTISNFEQYMAEGGGLIIVHAANNAWGDWDAFNEMIGLGAWGDRNTQSGPYVYYDNEGRKHIDDSEGMCGSHGPQYEFALTTRAPEHPIMKGLPNTWLHTKDELYDRMRGPAKQMTVLATAYSDKEENSPPWDQSTKGTGRHEPMLMAINYEKGRVFHTALGHMGYSMECVGFMTTFQRGAEWVATGEVTQPVPEDFPTREEVSFRKWDGGM